MVSIYNHSSKSISKITIATMMVGTQIRTDKYLNY